MIARLRDVLRMQTFLKMMCMDAKSNMNIPSISPEARMLGMNILYPESSHRPMMSSPPPHVTSRTCSGTMSFMKSGKYASHGAGLMNADIDAYRKVNATPKRRRNHAIGVLIEASAIAGTPSC